MLTKLKSSLKQFYPYAKKQLGFDRPVRLFLKHDANNATDVYGKTAYYDPQEEKVVLYVTNRHPKDILRSFAHELVHHKQNCDGRLHGLAAGEGYAQTEQGEQLEKEAYLGSMMFRNFEDTRRKQMTTEELKQKVESIVKEYLDEKKGKYDDGDGKDEKCDYVDCEDEGDKKEKVDEKYDDDVVDAQTLAKKFKKKEEVDEGSCGKKDDDVRDTYGDEVTKRNKKTFKKALSESKKVIKETPKQEISEPKQNNEDWYWGSLYSKLKDKWTK